MKWLGRHLWGDGKGVGCVAPVTDIFCMLGCTGCATGWAMGGCINVGNARCCTPLCVSESRTSVFTWIFQWVGAMMRAGILGFSNGRAPPGC